MTVVVVCDVGTVDGGAVQVAVSTAIELARRGHEVRFFAGTALGQEFAGTGVEARSLEMKKFTDLASAGAKIRKLLARRKIVSTLRNFLQDLDPKTTILHAHLYLSVIPGKALASAMDHGYAGVLTCHDYLPVCPNANFYNFRTKSICHLSPFSARCWMSECTDQGRATKTVRMVRLGTDRYWDRTWLKWNRIVYVSEFSRRIIEPFFGDVGRGVTLYNPCDIDRGDRVDASSNQPVVWLGRMVIEKDPTILASAAAATSTPVTFVGDGPLLPDVRAANREAITTGWVDRSAVISRLGGARALAITSRWYETAGLVAVEALARGVPVIVPDTCAAQEFVVDGHSGYVFRSGDEKDLARVLDLVKDDATVDRLSRAAYDRYWRDPFTMDRHIAGLVAVYEQAIAAKRSGAR